MGDEVTLADAYLIPQLNSARRYGIDLKGFKNMIEIQAELEILPEFIKAHANNQPDAPASVKS